MSAARRRLVVAAGSALALLVVIDLGLSLFVIRDGLYRGRPLPPYGAITHPVRQGEFLAALADPERESIGRFDETLGWTYRPNARNRDGSAHTNALGARGRREYAAVPPAGVTRIAAFGDSFTWCEEVSDEKTWGHLLEKRRPDVEVLNLGVGGYGTDQALLRYRALGGDLDADVVTIGLLLENIGRNVNRYRPRWALSSWMTRAKPRFVLERDELVLVPQPYASEVELLASVRDGSVLAETSEHEYWLGPDVPTGRLSSLLRLAYGWKAHLNRRPRGLWLEPEGEPYRVTVALLEAFRREALGGGARLVPVLVFPTKSDLRGLLDEDDRYWAGPVADLEACGIPVLDLTEPLFERYRELAADGRELSLFSGYHLSRAGNAIVADALARFVDARLPDEREDDR